MQEGFHSHCFGHFVGQGLPKCSSPPRACFSAGVRSCVRTSADAACSWVPGGDHARGSCDGRFTPGHGWRRVFGVARRGLQLLPRPRRTAASPGRCGSNFSLLRPNTFRNNSIHARLAASPVAYPFPARSRTIGPRAASRRPGHPAAGRDRRASVASVLIPYICPKTAKVSAGRKDFFRNPADRSTGRSHVKAASAAARSPDSMPHNNSDNSSAVTDMLCCPAATAGKLQGSAFQSLVVQRQTIAVPEQQLRRDCRAAQRNTQTGGRRADLRPI